MIGYFSRGIGRLPNLDRLLEDECVRVGLFNKAGLTHVAGWGRKPSARRARRFAKQRNLPYLSLEDGFLRSLDLGVQQSPPHSLIVDATGIYYDATRPSDLEQLIESSAFDAEELQRARRGIDLLRRYRLSKYNHAPDSWNCPESDRRRVLVVDQTVGDASVTFGMADEQVFVRMLDAAISEHPEAEILVKTHPDVIAGKKKGYLLEATRDRDCVILAEDLSPWALFDCVDDVYVVTSQLGFDALLAGKRVHCFGMPFYAGWGLTRDELNCDRRGVTRSLEQVFAAAYLRYCRFINPHTGKRCELEDTIRLLATQRAARERLRGQWLAVGFPAWKRRFLPAFLGHGASVKFVGKGKLSPGSLGQGSRVLAWASAVKSEWVASCDKVGIPLWRMEDGFIRSVGLGSDRVTPLSLVVDSSGIYYDAEAPSDLERLLNHARFEEDLIQRAENLRHELVKLRLSKYNLGVSGTVDLPSDRRVILVPGQVETDASIAKGSPQIKHNRKLLQAVREANPDACILYKPHPDVLAGGRYGALQGDAGSLYDVEVTDVSISELLEQVDQVHTMSSLTGFEALLRGIEVHTYGLPFYAGWGLTNDSVTCARRNRGLTLDELVAATLIAYPLYIDPQRGEVVDVETAVQLLVRERSQGKKSGTGRFFFRLVRNRFFRQ